MEKYIKEKMEDFDTVSVEYDIDAFNDGVESMSKFCGKVASLINLGITPDAALNYFSHRAELSTSKEITKMESDCRVECSKNVNIEAMEENI